MDAKRLAQLADEASRRHRPLLFQRGRHVALRWQQSPRPQGSFGIIDDWAAVGRELEAAFGQLLIPFKPDSLGWIDRLSLRLFRFDEDEGRLEMIPDAVPHRELPVVYTAIDRPGRYGLIGVNDHPLINEAIRLFCRVRTVARALSPEMRPALRDRLCETILCASDMNAIANSPDALRAFAKALGREPPKGDLPPPLPHPARPGETICDRCHGIDILDLPECDILDEPLDPGSRPCGVAPWEVVGPDHISGAMRQILVDPTDRRRLYSVAANGGVWRLDNVDQYPTQRWRPLTDRRRTLRFRTMAVAPSNGAILYAANSVKELGTAPIRVYSEIYRSRTRGLSWRPIQANDMGVIHRIAVHGANPDIVFAATSTGLWRRGDVTGGWERLFQDDCLDVALDPQDSSIVYMGVRSRGVFKSFTSGDEWTTDSILPFDPAAAGNGPQAIKIALGVRNADGTLQSPVSRTLVVRFGNEICVSSTSGEGGAAAWRRGVPVIMGNNPTPPPPTIDLAPGFLQGGNTRRSDTSPRRGNEWCNCLAVDPFDPDHILTGSVSLLESPDGGATWTRRASAHEDEHSVVFDDERQGLAYIANDGGLFSSIDGGTNWANMSLAHVSPANGRGLNLAKGLVTSELRHSVVRKGRAIAMIDHTGFVLTEDFAGRWQFLFNSADNSARHAHESSLVFACPTSLDRYYILNLRSGDDPTGVTGRLAQLDFTRTNGLVDPPALSFLSPLAAALPTLANFFPEQVVYRQHLPGPFAARFSRSAGERLLLFGSGSAAAGFTIQSLRLPTNGTTVTQAAQEGAHPTEPFLAMTFVPNDPDRAFAISAGGELFERDFSVAGAFSAVNQWILQAGDLFVSRLLPVTRPSLQIYALSQSAIGRFDDDTRTWSTVHVWPDPEETLMSLAAHPTREGTLFLGTSRSVYLSETGGDAWIPYASGLPNVPVTELTFDQGWLYAATYGRGLWRCSPCTG